MVTFNLQYLGPKGRLVYENHNAVCYAGVGRRVCEHPGKIVKLRSKFRGRAEDKYENLNIDLILKYLTGVNELFFDNPLPNLNKLADSILDNEFTIELNNRYSFDAFSICTLLRYFFESPDIIKNFDNLIQITDKFPMWKLIFMAHSGITIWGTHSLLGFSYRTYLIPEERTPKDFLDLGRKNSDHRFVFQDPTFASGTLTRTYEKLIQQESGYQVLESEPLEIFLKEVISKNSLVKINNN